VREARKRQVAEEAGRGSRPRRLQSHAKQEHEWIQGEDGDPAHDDYTHSEFHAACTHSRSAHCLWPSQHRHAYHTALRSSSQRIPKVMTNSRTAIAMPSALASPTSPSWKA